MAKTNFNFQATLKLNSKEFQKGVKDIQRSLNGLKRSFMEFAGALGLSLGFGKLISSLKDTSLQLDTAKNVLHNVSKGLGEYGDNMVFLKKISNQYNQDLITLINTFGQFRAAADTSGLAVEQLRDIYGSLVRAAGAFHMSADRTKDMLIAVQQMFSKGRVAAEELRRQLGNSLPGAFNLMAKAAGIAGITANGTTAELEDMMRKGKVLAADVMPAFAKVLDEVTAAANFDSMQGSLNRFKNSWTNFVEKSGFGDFFKKFVDAGTKALDGLANNVKNLVSILIGGTTGLLGVKLWRNGAARIAEYSKESSAQIDKLSKKYMQAKKQLNALNKQGGFATMDKKGKGAYVYDNLKNSSVNGAVQMTDQWIKAAKTARAYNTALLETNEKYKEMGRRAILTKKQVAALTAENEKLTKLVSTRGEYMVASLGRTSKAVSFLRKSFAALGATIKAAFGAFLFGAIIAAITSLITKVVETRKEFDRIHNIVGDTDKEIKKSIGTESETIVNLKRAKKMLEDNEKGSHDWVIAMQSVNKIMGLTGDKAFTVKSNTDDIVSACNEWIRKLKKVAAQEAIIAKIKELTSKNVELQAENEATMQDPNYKKKKRGSRTRVDNMGNVIEVPDDENLTRAAIKLDASIEKNNYEIYQNNKAIDRLLNLEDRSGSEMGPWPKYMDDDALTRLYGAGDTTNTGGNGGGGETETNLKKFNKVFVDFNNKVNELDNQLKARAITTDKYQEELNKAITSAYEAATAFGDLDEYLKGFSKGDIDKAKKQLEKLKLLFNTDVITEDDYYKEKGKELFDKIDGEVKRGVEESMKKGGKWLFGTDTTLPRLKKRDTTYDYKLTGATGQATIAGENYENTKEWLDALKELRDQLIATKQQGTEAFEKLNILIGEVAQRTTNLGDLAKLAQWKADIEELSKAYQDKLYSSVRDVASSFERLYNVYKDFAEVFGVEIDPDNNFQKILTIFGSLFETFETIYAIVKSIQELETAGAALEKAKNDAKMKALEQEIGLTAALGAAEVTAAEAATAAIVGQTAAQKALADAQLSAAGAAAAENAMKVPYPGNLAALASNVAAIVAAFATVKGLQAFAKGGIVGGNSTHGDNNLVRANSGEMLLTKAQQGTLFNMLNGKAGMGSGQVEFKIRGADLVGTLKNYGQKTRG